MIALLVCAAATIWLACGYIAAAANFAYFQRQWPVLAAKDLRCDRRESGLVMVTGLLSLLVSYVLGHYRHGFVWNWPWSPGADTDDQEAS